MASEVLKVGELARRSAVSVRTLHHYHEIGLLVPSHHSPGGHRQYSAADLARLQQIRSLQQLGFSLEEIGHFLDRRDSSPLAVLEMHLARLREQLEQHQELCERLETLGGQLRASQEVSIDALLAAIEAMERAEKYFTPEQRERLRRRGREVDPERMRQVEAEWQELLDRFEASMREGKAADSAPVQALARKARDLVREFSGGDAGIEKSLGRMYQQEGPEKVLGSHGMHIDPEVFRFMGEAMRALGGGDG